VCDCRCRFCVPPLIFSSCGTLNFIVLLVYLVQNKLSFVVSP
jgi:hypothetical protein